MHDCNLASLLAIEHLAHTYLNVFLRINKVFVFTSITFSNVKQINKKQRVCGFSNL